MSQPAPSAILLSAIRSARCCASLRPAERSSGPRSRPRHLGSQQSAVAGDDVALGIDQDWIGEAERPDLAAICSICRLGWLARVA